ncbi:MAG: lipopolysaccharide biosynthesis protein [Eubacteriales bacterium]
MKNIIILPVLAKFYDAKNFGMLVTVVSLIALIASSLGNSLTSTRLILEEEYTEANVQGDFNIVCLIVSFLGMLFVILISAIFPKLSFRELLIISAILFFETYSAYHSGWFILRQAYNYLLFYTLIGGVGFCIGLYLTYLTRLWPLTYLIADFLFVLFLVLLSPLVRERYICTNKFRKTISKYFILISATLVTNTLTYLDRLMLFPLIGGTAVAAYTTASFFGKAYSLIAIPISTILLGYFASGRTKLNLKKFWLLNSFMIFVLVIFLIFTSFFGKWATGLVYPNLISSASPYIVIANMSSAIAASAQITKSAVLKYADSHWILIIQIMYAIIYGGMGYYLTKQKALFGFAFAALIANICQIIMLYFACHMALKNKS